MKLMAIGAHPDDIEIFMYGLISLCKKKGDDIFLCVVTDGSLGGEKQGVSLAKTRKQETLNGLHNIAIPYFLGFPDGNLINDYLARKVIFDYITDIKPDLIVTHAPEDYHVDHKALSLYVTECANFHYPVLFSDTLMGVNFVPNYYVDITSCFQSKREAILAHKSQNPQKFFEATKLQNRFRAAQCNSPKDTYAEAYRFDPKFPFCDIRNLIPPGPIYRPYYIKNSQGFL
ncbi:PIG-L family deacetylase [Alphaproteobacteria bacterium]|nr:PIG-L family deacetylase [Alphaproteobacteria bacterium]